MIKVMRINWQINWPFFIHQNINKILGKFSIKNALLPPQSTEIAELNIIYSFPWN